MNRSLADIAHDIISKVNANKIQIDLIRDKIKRGKSKLHDRVDSILLSKMCMDAESVMREFDLINASVHRQGEELNNLDMIADMLPNVTDHRAGASDDCEAGSAFVAGSGASPCWADFPNKYCDILNSENNRTKLNAIHMNSATFFYGCIFIKFHNCLVELNVSV